MFPKNPPRNRHAERRAVPNRVNTVDAMHCTVPRIDWDVLEKITNRILSEVDGVCRVCYDLSPKPIATIEWE